MISESSKKNYFKILRISSRPSFKNPGKGLAPFILSQSDNFETILFSPSAAKGDFDLLPKKNISKIFNFPFVFKPLPFKATSLIRLISTFNRVLKILLNSVSILLNKSIYNCNIVHIHHIIYSIPAIVLKLKGAKIFITIHGSDIHKIRNNNFMILLLSLFDLILCVSESQKIILSKSLPSKKIQKISNGVDAKFFEPSKDYMLRENFIISVGNLRWQKNFKLLINSFANIHNKLPNWKLVILGEGEDRNYLEKLIGQYHLEDYIFLPGSLSREELKKYLHKSKIFVLPSKTEGLPKALLEALASGCVCITTNVGECPFILNEVGFIINNQNELNNKIIKLINSDKDLNNLSKKSIERSLNYSWKTYVKNHIEIYSRMINQKNK